MGRSTTLEAREPRHKKRVFFYRCMKCLYSSNRYYNVLRHEVRIHSFPKRQPQCCGIKFESKADYYIHCENFHPGKRTNLTSQKKYGIRAGSAITESIVDRERSAPRSEEYPEIKYMLRSRVRSKNDGLAGNRPTYAEDSDAEESLTKSAEKTSGYGTSSFSSCPEARDGNRLSDLDDVSNDEKFPSDDSRYDRNESSSNDYHFDRNESSSDDSLSARNESSSDDVKPKFDESRMSIDEKRVSVYAEPNRCENFHRDRSYCPNEENVSTLGNESIPMRSSATDCETRKTAIELATDLTKASFDSGVPIASTPLNLPLKKRILRDLETGNRENIVQSRKPVGDRLYRRPIMTSSKFFSMYDDAENVPPIVSINYSCENRVLGVELSKKLTARHRDFLSSVDFDLFYKI